MTTQASDLRQAFQAALSHSSPLLPKKELAAFVSYYFESAGALSAGF